MQNNWEKYQIGAIEDFMKEAGYIPILLFYGERQQDGSNLMKVIFDVGILKKPNGKDMFLRAIVAWAEKAELTEEILNQLKNK